MNKLQMIKLLEQRGVTKLEGISIADAIRQSGGEPTIAEMANVNLICMNYFANELTLEKNKNKELQKRIDSLESRSEWLSSLEAAGVDNWEGYSIARGIQDGRI